VIDLNQQESELLRAERDIADAEHRVSNQALLVERLRSAGRKTEEAEKLLSSMRTAALLLHERRAVILRQMVLVGARAKA
jgi:hypothetical protein